MIRYYNGDYGFPAGNPAGVASDANMLAGSPGYMPSSRDIENRLFDYGMQNTNRGRQIEENIKKIRESLPASLRGVKAAQAIPVPGAQPMLPQAMGGFQGGVPTGNAAFFPGGQLPQGFIGKTVV
jgi:hypothetical protein